MPIPLLAMALGGAAVGALANKKDRKKGALMGLGLGLTGGALGVGAAAPLAAPVVSAVPLGAAAAPVASGGAALIPEVVGGAAELSNLAKAGKFVGGASKAVAPALAMQALTPEKNPGPGQDPRSFASTIGGQQPQGGLYQQAAINTQERMKRRNHTRGFR